MGQPAGRRGRQVLEDTLHRFHLQLLTVCRLHLVEGGVGAYEYQGGSCGGGAVQDLLSPPAPSLTLHTLVLTQDPEDSRTSTRQPEEGERDTASQGVLMRWAHLPAWGQMV